MYNSQYYTCEQIDQRLLQGYLDDYNTKTGQSLTKAQFLTKLGNIFSKEGVIDNTATQIGYYECDTAAGTAAKAITVTNYTLFAGGSMKVKFANKNTANNATLNINSQGAKALYYQGERASATNSWDAEEVVEIYYDGTSYYANNVKGGSGSGVYDVSKEHPTSGPNSDGKFTLDYILNSSNVNELIPVNKRYPGMSIQFVSTYDNKYVQARFMLSTFTADQFGNVANWQGVDSEPKFNSKNLVESGGVYNIKNELADFAGKVTDYIIHQNWIGSNGKYADKSSYTSYKCVCIPIKTTDVIKVSKALSQNTYCAFLTSLEYIDTHDSTTYTAALCSGTSRISVSSSSPTTLTVPEDAVYLYIGLWNGSDCTPQILNINGYDCKMDVKEYIVTLESEIDLINKQLSEEVTLPTSTWSQKSYNANSGDDGIFWDVRNVISYSSRLKKIHLKCNAAGTVIIHYLSTVAPYNDIYTQLCEVKAGTNHIEPSPLLDYTESMYVAFQNTDGTGVKLVFNGETDGQSRKKLISDGTVTTQTYPYALWIDVVKNKEVTVTSLNELKQAISSNIANIHIGEATITLDSTISLKSGTKITGVRGKSVINVPVSVLKGIELSGKEDIVIENITLIGAYNGTPLKSGLQPVKSGIVDTDDDARQFVNAGYQTDLTNGGVTYTYIPQIGINIKSCEKIEILGCEIKNFSYYGIANALSGKNYRYACKFEKNYINNCYCGIYLYKEAERSQYIANNVSLCQIGLYLDSGTNMFTDCAFSANRIGMFMGNGVNHAHGVQNGNAFTHCSLFSIYAYHVENGEVFSQCKFGYVDSETGNQNNAIYAKNSRGLVFNNCQMIQCNIKFDGKFYLHYTGYTTGTADQFGNTNYVVTYNDISGQASQYNGGVSQILGSSYISGGGTITLSSDLDATNVIMKNNFFISGQDSSGVNN